MQIILHKNYLGTDKHLLVNTDSSNEFVWCKDIPEHTWILGTTTDLYSLDILSQLLNINLDTITDQSHIKSFENILSGSNIACIPWHFIYDTGCYMTKLNNVIRSAQNAVHVINKSSYTPTWLKGRSLLLNLQRAKIDINLLTKYLTEEEINSTTQTAIRSFTPDHTGYADKCVYNTIGTTTGRLTVQSGPMILTIPSSRRDILISRFAGGMIGYIDFVSLEPRVIKYITSDCPDTDIYLHMLDQFDDKHLTRDDIKKITLAILYGAASGKIRELTKSHIDITRINKKIKEYFQLDFLTKYLNEMYHDHGHLTNMMGRPLAVDIKHRHTWISHFIQSSAVDIALCGFNDIMVDCRRLNLNVVPIFNLHDALIIDIHPDSIKEFTCLVSQGVTNSLGRFPLSLKFNKEV